MLGLAELQSACVDAVLAALGAGLRPAARRAPDRSEIPARPARGGRSRPGGRGARTAVRRGAVHTGPSAHPRHAAERGRDGPSDVAAARDWRSHLAGGGRRWRDPGERSAGRRVFASACPPLSRQYTGQVAELSGGLPSLFADSARSASCVGSAGCAIGDNPPRDACGVFGVWAPAEEVSKLTYYGLYALQHRGQESAGIAVSDGIRIVVYKDMGLVAQVFDESVLKTLRGHVAIGHCRYSPRVHRYGQTHTGLPVYREVGACARAQRQPDQYARACRHARGHAYGGRRSHRHVRHRRAHGAFR